MPIYVSNRILYRLGAVAATPVAIYNLMVAFSDMDALPQHTKSLTGGIGLVVLIIVLLVCSFVRIERQVKIGC